MIDRITRFSKIEELLVRSYNYLSNLIGFSKLNPFLIGELESESKSLNPESLEKLT